jgi:hypothetical protein
MAGNSRSYIMAQLFKGPITEGWGAITVFNRTRLNRILLQQWIDKYDGSGYMPPFSGRAFINEAKTEYADLNDIVLASPRLSFDKHPNFNNSIATLTLNILSGTYTAYGKANAIESVLYSYKITEAQGYTLTIDVNLSVVVGAVDHLGRVVLDLSRGTSIECNLAGPSTARKELGKYFQQRFNDLPPHRRVFELGMLDFNGYDPLTPDRFEIRTQAAPGASDARASNFGDGAVVVFIKLRDSEFGGGMPPSHFPYLIPDDEDAQGDLYTATVILAEKFVPFADEHKLALIHSLLFPGEDNVFIERDRDTAFDMAIFGNIDPSRTAITIERPIHSIQAGSAPFQYRALRDGKPLSGVTWSVRSLNTQGSSGVMEPTTGRYTPVAADKIGRETVRNVVTASYTDPVTGQKYRVSALLLVVSEPMAISPVVVPYLVREVPQKITFVATAIGDAPLSWSQPEHGSLEHSGNTAIYTPPAELTDDLLVQPIKVRNEVTGETVEGSVVLLKYASNFNVTPGFVRNVNRSGTQQLTEHDRKPDLKRRWKVLGQGSVTDNGLYTAPSTFSNPSEVVVCELIDEAGEIQYYGYSLIQLSKVVNEPTWKDLKTFNISKEVEGAFANGMQQMMVRIHVDTMAVGTPPVTYQLSEDEKNSLVLMDRVTRDKIPFIEEGQEGIEPGSDLMWAANWNKNRFDARGSTPQDLSTQGAVLATMELLYVHVRSTPLPDGSIPTPDPTQFVASFVKDVTSDNFYSDRHPGENNTENQGYVTLKPQQVPRWNLAKYTVQNTRVAGGGAGGVGRPTGPGWDPLPPGEDDFDYFLKTTDYWRLTYMREAEAIPFYRCKFEKNASIVKWESQYGNETMLSFTGYAFHLFGPGEEGAPKNRVVSFDPLIAKIRPPITNPDFENDQTPVSGQLLITLSRIDNLRRSYYTELYVMEDTSMVASLLDAEGNSHRVNIRFATDNRNKLVFTPLE